MALEAKTIIEQIELHRSGVVFIKMYKVVVMDGKVLNAHPHRTVIHQEDAEDGILDDVDAHLQEMGFPALDQEDRQWVRDSMANIRLQRPRDTRNKFEVPANESVQMGAIGVEQGRKGPLV